jgi:hypothetical protein
LATGLLTAIYLPVLIYGDARECHLLLGSACCTRRTRELHLLGSFPPASAARPSAPPTTSDASARSSPRFSSVGGRDYSIGIGIARLGVSYAICALVPGLFIREKMFDPKAVETPVAAGFGRANEGSVRL